MSQPPRLLGVASFKHCPICGAPGFLLQDQRVCICRACDFHYYLNPIVAVAAFLADETGRILLIRRAKDPGKGKLGPPGGFVDVNETAEIAVRREVKEEVNLDILDLRYLASFPNEYLRQGRIWPVLDLFFTARVRAWSELAALDEVESYVLRDPTGVSPGDLAFPSMVAGLQAYNARNGLTIQQTDP